MAKNQAFIRTDLAQECKEARGNTEIPGIDYQEKTKNGIKILSMEIKDEKAGRRIGKAPGKYITIEAGKIWLMSDEQKDEISTVISESILEHFGSASSILAIGLGNREITADALGPKTADRLLVTRHVKAYDPVLFDQIGQEELSAFCPGVVGQTGIETFELIKGACESVKPDIVIVIDALAARSVDRLATTVQISDSGLAPGSGIGNKRKMINSDTLGLPVLAVGIPTVVDSSTLVYDSLEKAGIENIDSSLRKVLENSKSFFVSLKESDIAIDEGARLLSDAINKAYRKNSVS